MTNHVTSFMNGHFSSIIQFMNWHGPEHVMLVKYSFHIQKTLKGISQHWKHKD